ncbi:hypothetical protein QV08_10110 [Gallibacterium salpingitidis]|uniref:Copper homeostasis protein n=1 Tax=Gallibacterium salpingitidis TaxID=505341 RepID=A0A1A7P3N0_9PAST|nr:copper resistance protein NlpE [Gallibacterium salpingitidis]OBW96430.1 hypothetical protein QS62_00350 [Gallibacterium salpingitidis]OBX06477.1 hypothetical protein QV08_10110 [Gallibacterium salpingitidis]
MKKLNYLFALLAAGTLIGCQQTTTATDNHAAVVGQYQGTLPCADCEGIKTSLSLNEDKSFNLTSEYLGKKDATFTENGIYTIANQVITLNTPASGEKSYYKITPKGLAVSDEQGTINSGENAADYILQKQ